MQYGEPRATERAEVERLLGEQPIVDRDDDWDLVLISPADDVQLLVPSSLVERVASTATGNRSLAQSAALSLFAKLPESLLVVVWSLPEELRTMAAASLRGIPWMAGVPLPTVGGFSLQASPESLSLTLAGRTEGEGAARALADAARRGVEVARGLLAALMADPAQPSGLRKLVDALAATEVRLDGTDVLVSATLQAGVAAIAALGVLGSNAYISYISSARAAQEDMLEAEAAVRREMEEAEFGNVREALLGAEQAREKAFRQLDRVREELLPLEVLAVDLRARLRAEALADPGGQRAAQPLDSTVLESILEALDAVERVLDRPADAAGGPPDQPSFP